MIASEKSSVNMDAPDMELEASPEARGENRRINETLIAYNIGGATFGEFSADPADSVIGETATFEIRNALIAGAEPGMKELYKSHRYGMLGSTWGYDLTIENPGMYECILHYAETYSEFFADEPNRTFKVEICGDAAPEEAQEAEFDVMVELGGAEFTAYTRKFSGIAVQTTLKIRETPLMGDAFLSGITCKYMGALE